jgi:hypothetical protein
MTGPATSLRSLAAQSISGILVSLLWGDMLKEPWSDGVLYVPPILRWAVFFDCGRAFPIHSLKR